MDGKTLILRVRADGGTLQGDTVDFDATTGTFSFTSGKLAVNSFNGTLSQLGGTLTPGDSSGITTVNGDYNLSSAGTIEIDLNGVGTAGVDFDQIQVNGAVNVNSDIGTGAALSVVLGYTPTVGDNFIIIDNDASDLVVGLFNGLDQLDTFNVENGPDTVTFQINYAGGNGNNDVALEVTSVVTTAPVAPLAAAAASETSVQTTQEPLRESSFVQLVPDEDVLVFDGSDAGEPPTIYDSPFRSPETASLGLNSDEAGFGSKGTTDDVADVDTNLPVLDDIDLIGLTNESSLSHDLYV